MKFLLTLLMTLVLAFLVAGPAAAQSHIVIYGSVNCPYTRMAISDHPDAVFYDVEQDPSKLDEMLYYSNGVLLYPIVVVDGQVYIGYQGDSCHNPQ